MASNILDDVECDAMSEDCSSLSLEETGMTSTPWSQFSRGESLNVRCDKDEISGVDSDLIEIASVKRLLESMVRDQKKKPHCNDVVHKQEEASRDRQRAKAPVTDQPQIPHKDVISHPAASHENVKNYDTDILMIHAEQDHKAASELGRRITKINTQLRVCLLEDKITPGHDIFTGIGKAYSETRYVFLYITEFFCKETLALFIGNACLKKTLEEKKFSVIPVHTAPKQSRKYKLDMMLDNVQSLDSFDSSFEERVKKLFYRKKE